MTRFLQLGLPVLLLAGAAGAQTLELRSPDLFSGAIRAEPGDTVQVDVWAELDSLSVSGIALHVSLPAGSLQPLDEGMPGQVDLQPFLPGQLFSQGVVATNRISSLPDEATGGRLHLEYAALFGPGLQRSTMGRGAVASFRLVVQQAVELADIIIEDTPILETRLVLPDGTTERRFEALRGISLSTLQPAILQLTSIQQASWAEVKGDSH